MENQPFNVEIEQGEILYQARFNESIKGYIAYTTLVYVLICLIFIPVYGIGLLMFIYLPVLRSVTRIDMQNRRLYITTENVVYITNTPVCSTCCGSTRTEKNVLLTMITDVNFSQSCLEAKYGVKTVSIANPGQVQKDKDGNAISVDLSINGIDDGEEFKNTLLYVINSKRAGKTLSRNSLKGATQKNSIAKGYKVAEYFEENDQVAEELGIMNLKLERVVQLFENVTL
eukprot:TRINITY_DN13409_c0_g1_i1.p1 TRINITY_DN13409_c0_g1~~TRINITY_DN13409_c0_g1_i1.p1  ORF type:complete len:229 (+),score=35.74 TRINITY_DN13409_c0_g1_i1:93-779(+)